MENLALGLATALAPANLLACLAGVVLGTVIGVIPGIGAMAAIALVLPLTFSLDPVTGIVMLAGIYYGAEYGGSTASILLNLPGTPSNAITCLDGYPMAQNGRAGVALFITTVASFIGGTIGIIVLTILSPAITTLAMAFGPVEYFWLILICFIAVAAIGAEDPKKNFAMLLLGGLVGLVGIDIYDGTARYTFGQGHLIDGLSLVPVAMGLFGLSEIILSARSGTRRTRHSITLRSMLPTRDDWKRILFPMCRGTGFGCIFGPLPGTGPSVAAMTSYAIERKLSKTPEHFGKGCVEGVAAPEASNNAAVQTSFIPTLSLGIPGTPTMAIMIGALMIHGIVPGPMLMQNQPDLFWGLVMSFWIGNVLLLILNIPLISVWVALLNIPYRLLYPAIVVLICIGSYSISNSVFDVGLVLMFGVVGYLLRLQGFAPAPLLIGFVLMPILEENLRRGWLMGRGDPMYFISSPVAIMALLLCALLLALPLIRLSRRSKPKKTNSK